MPSIDEQSSSDPHSMYFNTAYERVMPLALCLWTLEQHGNLIWVM